MTTEIDVERFRLYCDARIADARLVIVRLESELGGYDDPWHALAALSDAFRAASAVYVLSSIREVCADQPRVGSATERVVIRIAYLYNIIGPGSADDAVRTAARRAIVEALDEVVIAIRSGRFDRESDRSD